MKHPAFLNTYARDPSSLLMILHEYQDRSERNFLTQENLEEVAEYLGVSRSWVYGVATYYSMFSLSPRGRHVIRVCKSPVCHIEGRSVLVERLRTVLGISPGETTVDGTFSVEYTECLGRCAAAPSLMIDDEVFGGAAVERMESIIESFRDR